MYKVINKDIKDTSRGITVGVMALQGAFREHIRSINLCGAEALEIRFPYQLDSVDGLIIPGGESTTISKLIEKYDFVPALDKFYRQEKPIFGTCAGLILLAKEINNLKCGLGYIDISVDRNAYGRQVDSFEHSVDIFPDDEQLPDNDNNTVSSGCNTDTENRYNKQFNAVFIRAPKISRLGSGVTVLARVDNSVVLAREKNVLICSFHPELTDDLRIHAYFLEMIKKSKNMVKSY